MLVKKKKGIWPKPISTQTPRPSISLSMRKNYKSYVHFAWSNSNRWFPFLWVLKKNLSSSHSSRLGFTFSLSLFESMESLSRLNNCHQNLHHLSLNHHRPLLPKPISSLFVTTPPSPSPPPSSPPPIRASSSPDPLSQNRQNPLSQTLKSLLRLTLPTIASTATVTLFFIRFNPKSLLVPTTTQPQPQQQPNGVITCSDLKVKLKVVDYLIELKPDDQAWSLLKTQIRNYSLELDSARFGFREILDKDLLCHKPHCGDIRECLEMADELKDLSLEIEAAMDNCIRISDIKLHLRDFKYLVARVRDSKRKVFGALKYFQELEQRDHNYRD